MPLILEVDCTTGAVRERAMSADEEAAHRAWQDRARTDQAAQAGAREQEADDRALLLRHGAGHPDPLVQAAARLLSGPRPD